MYSVNADGTLSDDILDGATSTLRGNPDGRNLPSAIGFQIVGDNYVVVTEAREFQPDGLPPAFPALQDGSVSTWQIFEGSFVPISIDVPSGVNNTGRTACWLDFSDENTFFVSNAIEAGIASYSFDNGSVTLIDQVAAQGTGATGNTTDPAAAFGTTEGWIDLWISDDGQFLYQCYGLSGEVGVYEINGAELTLLQEIGGLPQNNVQGIVSVGTPTDDSATLVADQPIDPRNDLTETAFITSSIADMTVYPNPTTSSEVAVNFNLATDTEVTLRLLSIDGSSTRVTYMNGENMRSGTHTERLDISSIANGVYIVQISTPTGILNEQLVVQN